MFKKYKRIWQSLRLMSIPSGKKRAVYVKKKMIFRRVGDHCMFQMRKVPLYPKLIAFHNNVRLASDVTFITHDVIHSVLNQASEAKDFQEAVGCIEVMDNVFIGSNSLILYGVRIGPNAIVAAGSIVTRDVPPNSIVAGIPAKVIGSYDDLVQKRRQSTYPRHLKPSGQILPKELEDWLWEDFEKKRS